LFILPCLFISPCLSTLHVSQLSNLSIYLSLHVLHLSMTFISPLCQSISSCLRSLQFLHLSGSPCTTTIFSMKKSKKNMCIKMCIYIFYVNFYVIFYKRVWRLAFSMLYFKIFFLIQKIFPKKNLFFL
jgi:hypothetical protein